MATQIQEAFRDKLISGVCPFCLRSGFIAISQHIPKKHHVYMDEVREMAHITKDFPVCSKEYQEQRRIGGYKRLIKAGPLPDNRGNHRKHNFSPRGREIAFSILRENRYSGPHSPETRKRMSIAAKGRIPWNKGKSNNIITMG